MGDLSGRRSEQNRQVHERDVAAQRRDDVAGSRDRAAESRDDEARRRDLLSVLREESSAQQDAALGGLLTHERPDGDGPCPGQEPHTLELSTALDRAAADRRAAAGDREAASEDRRAARQERLAAHEDRLAAAADRAAAAAKLHRTAVARAELAALFDRLAAGRDLMDAPVLRWDELTEAERRVAQLVAHGLTNRQIAQRLVVSAHTVDSHLKSVYAKLGIGSRVQLTRMVLIRQSHRAS
jgi:DNA-binding CsgD family transcriptional regulator